MQVCMTARSVNGWKHDNAKSAAKWCRRLISINTDCHVNAAAMQKHWNGNATTARSLRNTRDGGEHETRKNQRQLS